MTRDLTHKQYLTALERNGFKPCGIGGLWVEHSEFPNTMFGTIYNRAKGRTERRATVARLIKDLDRARKREKARASK